MYTFAEVKRKEKQEEIQAKRVARANERDERNRKKAAIAGSSRGQSAKYQARISDTICLRANAICSTLPKIEQAPAHDYCSYVNNRQAAYDDGENSYCVFGGGAKHITRQFFYGHSKKIKFGSSGKVSVEIVPYSAEHNDRTFESDNALHIDPQREPENLYWNIYDGYYRRPTPFDRRTTKPTKDREIDPWLERFGVTDKKGEPLRFADAEMRFVHEHFADAISQQNAKHKAAGNTYRLMDTDDPLSWRDWMKKHPPQEMLLMVGNRDDSVTPDKLEKITPDFLNLLREKYNFVAIDFAIHCDEDGAPHVHIRGYFIALDENCLEIPNRSLALRQRGIMPSLGKKQAQALIDADKSLEDYDGGHFYNNTITFTEEASEILFQLAEKYGVKVTRTPYKSGGLSKKQYVERAKSSVKDARIALEKLEKPLSTQELRQCVLTILEGVDKGLNYYPTQWTDPNAVMQAEREMRPALKKAREITEKLPEILRKQHIESPDAELENLQERIKRTHRALGRAKNNAGGKDAKRDDGATGNQAKHRERVEWLRRLLRMYELLQQDMTSYDEEYKRRLAAEAMYDDERAKRLEADARVRELEKALAAANKVPAPEPEAAKPAAPLPASAPEMQTPKIVPEIDEIIAWAEEQVPYDESTEMPDLIKPDDASALAQEMRQNMQPPSCDDLRAKLQPNQQPAPEPVPEPTPEEEYDPLNDPNLSTADMFRLLDERSRQRQSQQPQQPVQSKRYQP